MKLIGQRWEYRVGNSIVQADNAFSWTLWSQERFAVNGETIAQSCGRFRFAASARQPWLTHTGEGELRVELRSAVNGIACHAFLDDELIEPERILVARWNGGKRSWPAELDWRDDVPLEWVAN